MPRPRQRQYRYPKLKRTFQTRLLNAGWESSVVDIMELEDLDGVVFRKGRDAIIIDDGGIFLVIDGARVAGWAWEFMKLKAVQAESWGFPNGFVYSP